jgi:hypothetical protein
MAGEANPVERYHGLAELTAHVARSAAELESAREAAGRLGLRESAELEELVDRLRALHVLLANEVERAWNAAEASARRARRAAILGQIHDAVSAETPLPPEALGGAWQELGPYGPPGPADGERRPDEL